MERKAILIDSSDVQGETDLPGARIDIANWDHFLRSSLGGAWQEDEIVRLHKPVSQVVKKLLADNADRYCFVAFSGHGTDGHVVLNDFDKRCPLSILTPAGERGTMVIDSCRGIEPATSFGTRIQKSASILAEQAPVTKLAREGSAVNFSSLEEKKIANLERAMSRSRFERSVEGSTAGLVTMLSCSAGEDADERAASGGLYTSALLDAAVKFHENFSGKTGELNTRQAHNYAAALMPPQQNPQYFPILLAFPFALKVVPIFVI